MTEEEFDAPTYNDNVRTQQHCRILADYLERRPIAGDYWPLAELGGVLPSARDMIVRALRELAPKLPEA